MKTHSNFCARSKRGNYGDTITCTVEQENPGYSHHHAPLAAVMYRAQTEIAATKSLNTTAISITKTINPTFMDKLNRTPETGPSQEVNQFTVELTEYMTEHFPERIDEKDFIEARAKLAAQTYTAAYKQSMRQDEALDEARKVLLSGLKYSPYLLVKRAVDEMFPMDDPEEQGHFTMQMLDRCRSFFGYYPVHEPDFAGSDLEEWLYTEIIGEISNYLKENGMS